eukprot:2952299-Rhodomonas_salina.1
MDSDHLATVLETVTEDELFEGDRARSPVTIGAYTPSRPSLSRPASAQTELTEVAQLRTDNNYWRVRAERSEKALRDNTRRRDHSSAVSALNTPGQLHAYARPKLATPPIFKGGYTVLDNVLTWLHIVEMYLEATRTALGTVE